MQNLLRFIRSIETEVSNVIETLRIAAQYTSGVRKYLDDVRRLFEEFAEKDNASTSPINSSSYVFCSRDLIRLLNITKELEAEVRATLGLAGLRLDSIRGEVIGAKLRFSYLQGSEELFFAIDELVSALDFACVSLESNISKVSSIVKMLGNN